VKANPLEHRPDHPTLMHVSPSHAVTVYKEYIFDYAEDAPLLNTRANLEKCIGDKFDRTVVKGYMFVPKPKKRFMATDLPPTKRPGSSDPA
jgi:hypothetical protein